MDVLLNRLKVKLVQSIKYTLSPQPIIMKFVKKKQRYDIINFELWKKIWQGFPKLQNL